MDLREIACDLEDALFGRGTVSVEERLHIIYDTLRSVAPRWVPVGEGLPPPGRDVPLLQPDGTWVIGWYERERERDCFWRAAWHGPIRVNATHWMPLPPPPEGGKEP